MTSLNANALTQITMFENWSNLDIKEQFRFLINCKCCERHQKNKPTDINKCDWSTIEQNANDGSLDSNLKCFGGNMCDCDCRHKARFICRNESVPA